MAGALVVVDLTVKDAEKLAEYGALAAPTVAAFEGEFIAKAPIKSLSGDVPFTTKVVIEFPSAEKAKAWYQSDEYQAIIPLREAAMDALFHLVAS